MFERIFMTPNVKDVKATEQPGDDSQKRNDQQEPKQPNAEVDPLESFIPVLCMVRESDAQTLRPRKIQHFDAGYR
jgi:hypothetical protein